MIKKNPKTTGFHDSVKQSDKQKKSEQAEYMQLINGMFWVCLLDFS